MPKGDPFLCRTMGISRCRKARCCRFSGWQDCRRQDSRPPRLRRKPPETLAPRIIALAQLLNCVPLFGGRAGDAQTSAYRHCNALDASMERQRSGLLPERIEHLRCGSLAGKVKDGRIAPGSVEDINRPVRHSARHDDTRRIHAYDPLRRAFSFENRTLRFRLAERKL